MDINQGWPTLYSSARMTAQASRRILEAYMLGNLFDNAISLMPLHVLAGEELLANAALVPSPVATLSRTAGFLPRHTLISIWLLNCSALPHQDWHQILEILQPKQIY